MSVSSLTQQALDFREERNWAQWHHAKTLGLGLFVEAGELAEHFLYWRDHELENHLKTHMSEVAEELIDVLYWLIIIAHESGFNLTEAFLHKMTKNLPANEKKKYVAVEVQLPETIDDFSEMIEIIQAFRTQRFGAQPNWQVNLEPRDVVYKLIEEIGEVAEYFQWKHEGELNQHLVTNRVGLSEEIADCLISVLLLAHSLQIDIEVEFERKMKKNREKYPLTLQQ